MSGQWWIRRKPEPCTCCQGFQTQFSAFPVYRRGGRLLEGGIYDVADQIPPDILTDQEERDLRRAIAEAGDHYELIAHQGARP